MSDLNQPVGTTGVTGTTGEYSTGTTGEYATGTGTTGATAGAPVADTTAAPTGPTTGATGTTEHRRESFIERAKEKLHIGSHHHHQGTGTTEETNK